MTRLELANFLLGRQALYQLNYIRIWYRRWDLNPHEHNAQRILSPLRLPIPPLLHKASDRS